MGKLSLILIALLTVFTGWSQSAMNKDSLLKVLKTAKDDTARVLLYIDIGYQYEQDDPSTAGQYYLMAGELSQRLHYKTGTIKFLTNYTGILNGRGAYDSALALNKQSFQLAREIHNDLYIGKTAANIGNSFNYLSEYDSAIYYYEMAGRYFEAMDNNYLLARMYEMEQLVYQNMMQYKKALQYGKMAVKELRSSGDSVDLSRSLLNLANSYQNNNFIDSALSCYKEALTISRKLDFISGEAASLLGIGNIYFHRYDADAMKPYFEKALALSKQSGDPNGEAIASRGMALYHLLKKELDKAKAFCIVSLKLTDSAGSKYDRYESMNTLSSILYAQGNIIEAEKVRYKMQLLENEIRGSELQQKTISIEKKFETEKKEAQIKLQRSQLHQKNTLNYILSGSAVALLLISLLAYRNYRHKQKLQQAKIDELETEKQLTATEAVLKGEEQERTRLAKDLHDGLGGMLSGIKYSLNNMKGNLILTAENARAFERSIDMLDSSIQEMRRVAHNMMPEVLVKYGLNVAVGEFCSEIDRSVALHVTYQPIGMEQVAIDQTIAVTIYRIVQELVNNAIKHAHAQNLLVQLQPSASEKMLMITVEDDGKGFDTAALPASKGIGWSNIQNRVEFLKGKIDVHSEPGKGTSVLIEVHI
ncbi:sensor histidine kinase [Niabella drilacis]|uniref:Tetratricopeptide repeat-containing protein n=1 Tax=Niabella drilacis (strain DSM 25811 / CCM 8410 / CCUG 62505 / LMG 26954 / E90) TaxID=1285928 RepID=A0A1G6WYD8_NIADE|nr:sensor histidine kinase [Niabella drilacis]SDD70673.1 Tetratricopeptide repeat-containing protein [Niabella drilacis]